MIAALLALLTQIAGITSEASTIAGIIETLVNLIPLLVKEYQALVTPVKNIITALQSNDSVTTEQLDQLAKMDAQIDADFETAATAAQAQDAE